MIDHLCHSSNWNADHVEYQTVQSSLLRHYMTNWPDREPLRFTIVVHDLVRALLELRNACHEMAQPVLIVGAGLAGLSLARTLSSHRVPVRIFEASPEIRKYSYGITLLSWAYQPLASTLKLGSVEELKAATATDAQVGGSGLISAQVKDAYTGATLLSDPPREPKAPQSYRCSRSKLGQLLAQGLDIEFGCKLDRVEQKASGMQLHFEGGKTAEGSLIVAADGIHSVGELWSVYPKLIRFDCSAFYTTASVEYSIFMMQRAKAYFQQ